MAKSRLVGSYPVIGIRPTIDGRRGALDVRGSLEDQTMNMAKSAAKLFEENLKYSNGEPVKVVIADTTIGRVGESAACADKFRKEGVDITLTVTPCWCYGAETMDMDPQTIKAVWGFNGTERPGAVYLASVLATHAQKGLPAFGIYGHDVQEADDTSIPADVEEKLLRFGRAAVAAASMRGKSYLQIGSVTMGIGGSIIDPDFIESYLGMRVESVDEVEIIRRMTEGIYDHEEFDRAMKWAKENCTIGFDKNPPELQMTEEQKELEAEKQRLREIQPLIKRAEQLGYENIDSLKDKTKKEMREIIHRERTVELAFENVRYFDLRRWREAEIVLNRPVHGVQITKDESTGEFIYSAPIEVEDRVFPERCYYYPIPQSELNKNAALTPNPGW